mmetsp:Transcript_10694/g.33265  ORF Transcript_10694/g.33265 Transcript_10694/m.33265 type:complete len:231 (+) Transcript_10694:216-908(+)
MALSANASKLPAPMATSSASEPMRSRSMSPGSEQVSSMSASRASTPMPFSRDFSRSKVDARCRLGVRDVRPEGVMSTPVSRSPAADDTSLLRASINGDLVLPAEIDGLSVGLVEPLTGSPSACALCACVPATPPSAAASSLAPPPTASLLAPARSVASAAAGDCASTNFLAAVRSCCFFASATLAACCSLSLAAAFHRRSISACALLQLNQKSLTVRKMAGCLPPLTSSP